MTTEQSILYECEHHGVWNACLASACPECMIQARREIEKLRTVAKELAAALGAVVDDGLQTNVKAWQKAADSALTKYRELNL